MGAAVVLCEFAADAELRSSILDGVLAFAIEGSGEILFVGRHRIDFEPDRELVAVRLSSIERAEAVVRAWRSNGAVASAVDVRLMDVEPMRPIDNPPMLFP